MQKHERPVWINTFSTGNVISMLGIIAAGIAVWVALQVSLAEAKTTIIQMDKRVDRLENRLEQRLESIDSKLDKINDRMMNRSQ